MQTFFFWHIPGILAASAAEAEAEALEVISVDGTEPWKSQRREERREKRREARTTTTTSTPIWNSGAGIAWSIASIASIAGEPHDLHATCHLGRHQAEWQGRFRSFLGWAGHRYCPSGRPGSWTSLDKSGVKVVLVEFPADLSSSVWLQVATLLSWSSGKYILWCIRQTRCRVLLSALLFCLFFALRIPPELLLPLLSPLLTFTFCLSAAADRHATSWSWWVCCWCCCP